MSLSGLPCILIVEGDAQMSRLLETILSGSDRELVSVGTAGEALAALEAGAFSLIILDLGLPDTDGRNFLKVLRERSATAGIPVMVLSGIPGSKPKTECFALGADAYFEKPLAPEVLRAAVSARLHRSVEHRREARQDALTGLPNRAAFYEGYQRLLAMAERMQEPAALALLDFDMLKRINDFLGHVTGDAALRHAARVFSDALRRSDFLARWGGDEFALLLPNTDLPGARSALEKMLSSLAGAPFYTQDGRPLSLSFSAGLVPVPPGAKVEASIAEADRWLFLAKTGGRARVVCEADQDVSPVRKILLAEEDEGIASLVMASLTREGFEVVRCQDGASALQAALNVPCELWIMDVNQETSPGKGLLSELRAVWRGGRVPVLMLAYLGADQAVARGFQEGADDYLVAPFTPYELMIRVRKMLRRNP